MLIVQKNASFCADLKGLVLVPDVYVHMLIKKSFRRISQFFVKYLIKTLNRPFKTQI